jgi:hypothetical protein
MEQFKMELAEITKKLEIKLEHKKKERDGGN